MKINNKGIGAVVVLLSILVVTAIGFAGYYVWNTQQDKKDNTISSDSKAASADGSTKTDDIQTSNPDDIQKYLVIKEWGVKMPLTDYLSDAEYTTNLSGSSNDYTVYLSKKSYTDAYSNCEGAGGAIVRFSNPNDRYFTDNARPVSFEDAKKSAIKIEDYYYIRISPQSMCGDENDIDTWANNSQQLSNEFLEAYKKLEQAN